jgi:hypothetical protein
MGGFYECAGCLTAQNGGFRPGQNVVSGKEISFAGLEEKINSAVCLSPGIY